MTRPLIWTLTFAVAFLVLFIGWHEAGITQFALLALVISLFVTVPLLLVRLLPRYFH